MIFCEICRSLLKADTGECPRCDVIRYECRNNCGAKFNSAAGRSAHERKCEGGE
jgi:hypothetical protein